MSEKGLSEGTTQRDPGREQAEGQQALSGITAQGQSSRPLLSQACRLQSSEDAGRLAGSQAVPLPGAGGGDSRWTPATPKLHPHPVPATHQNHSRAEDRPQEAECFAAGDPSPITDKHRAAVRP